MATDHRPLVGTFTKGISQPEVYSEKRETISSAGRLIALAGLYSAFATSLFGTFFVKNLFSEPWIHFLKVWIHGSENKFFTKFLEDELEEIVTGVTSTELGLK